MGRRKLELELEEKVYNDLNKMAEPKGLTIQEFIRVILGNFVDTNTVNLQLELGKFVKNIPFLITELFKLRKAWKGIQTEE